jgi:hypothetical protein
LRRRVRSWDESSSVGAAPVSPVPCSHPRMAQPATQQQHPTGGRYPTATRQPHPKSWGRPNSLPNSPGMPSNRSQPNCVVCATLLGTQQDRLFGTQQGRDLPCWVPLAQGRDRRRAYWPALPRGGPRAR